MKSTVMKLAPHEQRVVVEAFELNEKLGKLRAFQSSDMFKSLTDEAVDQLNRQADVMAEYLSVLDERLHSFEVNANK